MTMHMVTEHADSRAEHKYQSEMRAKEEYIRALKDDIGLAHAEMAVR